MKKTKTTQTIKFISKTILFFALILFSCHVFVDLFEDEIVDMLVKKLKRATRGQYLIKYEKVNLNLFKRGIYVTHISIHPKESIVNTGQPESRLRGTLIKASIPLLRIEGISILPFIFHKSLTIKDLFINNGELILFKSSQESKPRDRSKKVMPIGTLKVSQLNINKTAFKMVEKDTNNPILDIPEISLQLSKIKVGLKEKVPQKIPLNLTFGKSTIKNPTYFFPEGFYKLGARNLSFSPLDSTVSIQSFSLTPMFERYEFSKKRGYRTNRITLKIDNIVLKGIVEANLFRDEALFLPLITLNNPNLMLFRDKNKPKNPVKKAKRFPQQLLHECKYKLKIDKVDILDGNISYVEHAVNKKQPGKLIFEQIAANIKNITNFVKPSDKEISMEISASAKIMGKSNFTTHMTFPLGRKYDNFTFSGSLEWMSIKDFNPMLIQNANIKIKSGVAHKLDFSANANDQRIWGKMTFLYKNLKLVMLKKGSKLKKSSMLSFLANQLIYDNNPRPGKPVRIGKILYKKEKPISFFRYIWKSLLSGIKSSISKKLGHTLF